MIHNLANRMASIFVRYGESSEEDADIYAYALEAVIAAVFNIVICIIISFLFGRVMEGIIFISVFALLRRFTGGYHANTHCKCILTFGILLTCAMLIISFVPVSNASILIAFVVAAIAWLGIFALTPIEDENKHYEDKRRAALRKKSIAVSTLLLALCVISGFVLNIYIALILSIAMLSVFGGMAACKIMAQRNGANS